MSKAAAILASSNGAGNGAVLLSRALGVGIDSHRTCQDGLVGIRDRDLRDLERCAPLRRELREEVVDQALEVRGALAQRREPQQPHRQLVVELEAEAASPDGVDQLAVGGRRAPLHVWRDRFSDQGGARRPRHRGGRGGRSGAQGDRQPYQTFL